MILLALMLCADVVVPVPLECGSPQGCGTHHSVARPVVLPDPMELCGSSIPDCPAGIRAWIAANAAAASPAPPPRSTPILVLSTPLPMEIVRQRLATGSTAVGLWNITITGKAGERIPRERIVMAASMWASAHRVSQPLWLTKEQAWPIIAKKAGGRWKVIQRLIGYAGIAGALAGLPVAAAAGPTMELLSQRAGEHIPDISALSAELPAVIIIPESGGITISAFCARMRNPQSIGPFEVYP